MCLGPYCLLLLAHADEYNPNLHVANLPDVYAAHVRTPRSAGS